jgi:Amt family ammonium transporter
MVAWGLLSTLCLCVGDAGFVGPLGAVCIGLLSGVICRFFATTVKHRAGYDDR